MGGVEARGLLGPAQPRAAQVRHPSQPCRWGAGAGPRRQAHSALPGQAGDTKAERTQTGGGGRRASVAPQNLAACEEASGSGAEMMKGLAASSAVRLRRRAGEGGVGKDVAGSVATMCIHTRARYVSTQAHSMCPHRSRRCGARTDENGVHLIHDSVVQWAADGLFLRKGGAQRARGQGRGLVGQAGRRGGLRCWCRRQAGDAALRNGCVLKGGSLLSSRERWRYCHKGR